MSRYTDVDAIIEDLRYDIELDARTLDDLDFADAKERELVQLDKDIKQNTISILEQTPTADVRENVHGNWSYCEKYDDYKCSACGQHSRGRYNFCPDCGAVMYEPEAHSAWNQKDEWVTTGSCH